MPPGDELKKSDPDPGDCAVTSRSGFRRSARSRGILSVAEPKRFRGLTDIPVGVKLWLLIVLNSSLALLLAGAGLLVYQRYEQRREAVRELMAQGRGAGREQRRSLEF